jgi:hypothetical protein
MDWCAAKTLLEMKCAALLKRLKTTGIDSRYKSIPNMVVHVSWISSQIVGDAINILSKNMNNLKHLWWCVRIILST